MNSEKSARVINFQKELSIRDINRILRADDTVFCFCLDCELRRRRLQNQPHRKQFLFPSRKMITIY